MKIIVCRRLTVWNIGPTSSQSFSIGAMQMHRGDRLILHVKQSSATPETYDYYPQTHPATLTQRDSRRHTGVLL